MALGATCKFCGLAFLKKKEQKAFQNLSSYCFTLDEARSRRQKRPRPPDRARATVQAGRTHFCRKKRGDPFFCGLFGPKLGQHQGSTPERAAETSWGEAKKEQALQGILSSSDNIKMGHHARPPAKSATPVERAVASAPCSPQRSEYAACEAVWRPAPSALRETPRPYGGSAALSAPPTLSKRKLSWSSLFSDQAGRPSSSRRISGGCA